MNGKGSKSRVKDAKAYRDNFDTINWTSSKRSKESLAAFVKRLNEESRRYPHINRVKIAELFGTAPWTKEELGIVDWDLKHLKEFVERTMRQ